MPVAVVLYPMKGTHTWMKRLILKNRLTRSDMSPERRVGRPEIGGLRIGDMYWAVIRRPSPAYRRQQNQDLRRGLGIVVQDNKSRHRLNVRRAHGGR